MPNLFDENDTDQILVSMRPLCQAAGLPLHKASLYSFFVKRVRKNIHISLCFSPMGEPFRTRLRNFPSLVNCCTIDYFAAWPEEALQSVAFSALEVVDLGADETKATDRQRCAARSTSRSRWRAASTRRQRRFTYVTPTSYLELLGTFKRLLVVKREEVTTAKKRLVIGLDKLESTEVEVDKLKTQLEEMQPAGSRRRRRSR